MKTISLRTLVREPLKVKRMTRAGQAVQVTDNGEPLWILHPGQRHCRRRRTPAARD
jgi:antitoxin (DNA-binding transcriptional repressor) of toxin-antitoxin stability system